jgi:hypothetical protein
VLIDRTGWTVEASSVESSSSDKAELYKAEHAIDDDITTLWHTPWVNPIEHPHWIIIDMGAMHYVDSMLVTPRTYSPDKVYSTASNPEDYEVWVSKDKNTWARVANGTLVYEPLGSTQTIKFLIPNEVQYVKFVSLSATEGKPAVTLGDIQITEMLPDVVISGGGVS